MTALTPARLVLLRKLRDAGGSILWTHLTRAESNHITNMAKMGLVAWSSPIPEPRRTAILESEGRAALAAQEGKDV